jgi:hypothetical protein
MLDIDLVKFGEVEPVSVELVAGEFERIWAASPATRTHRSVLGSSMPSSNRQSTSSGHQEVTR